jgi:RNA polymerase sigma-70 factor (ECF subfamily)
MQLPDPVSIIRQAKDGSQEALNTIFNSYGAKLMALIRLRMGPSLRQRVESQDVLQQTMLKAYQHLEQFGGAGETSLMAWMGAIARNEIRDLAKFMGRQGRDARNEVPLDLVSEIAATQLRTAVSRLHLEAQVHELERAIESLGEDHREVILLRRFEELSFPEIGARLDRSPDACRMLYSRAMAALTIELERSLPNKVDA